MDKLPHFDLPIVSFLKMTLVFIILIALQTTGCSVIGFMVGVDHDATKPKTTVVESNYHEKIRKNKTIIVTLDDGTQLEGKCDKLILVSDSVYSTYFDRSKSTLTYSPKPNDRITIVTSSEDRFEGTFLGYDLTDRKLVLVPGSARYGQFVPIVVRMAQFESGQTVDIFLNVVRSMISPDSTVYNVFMIRKLAANNNLPLPYALSVTNQSGNQLIPLNNIVSIEQPTSKNSKWNYLVVGLAIDATLAILMALTFESWVTFE